MKGPLKYRYKLTAGSWQLLLLLQRHTEQRQFQQENDYVGGVSEADTDRMKPELHNRCIVELVYLASHGDEAVAVLNLLNILLSGCLCSYLTQHCLSECQPHMKRRRKDQQYKG